MDLSVPLYIPMPRCMWMLVVYESVVHVQMCVCVSVCVKLGQTLRAGCSTSKSWETPRHDLVLQVPKLLCHLSHKHGAKTLDAARSRSIGVGALLLTQQRKTLVTRRRHQRVLVVPELDT